MSNSKDTVYLDHAATTPVRESAQRAWLETVTQLQANPGNPAALHSGGRSSRRILEDARERLAFALGADRAEVVFTSGATESAALGVVGAARAAFDSANPQTSPNAVVVSSIEHPAVANQEEVVQASGLRWRKFQANTRGVTVPDLALVGVQPDEVILASVCWVCSETGVIQPVEQVVELAKESGFLVHSDATQAVGNIAVNFQETELDLMTIGGHKFGAPVGSGALLVKRGVSVKTDRRGGDQERKIRSGTPDVAGAVALAVAAEEASREVSSRAVKHTKLRELLARSLPEGVRLTEVDQTVPGIVHLSLPTKHPEALLLELDRAGIMASAGSACHAGVTRPSEVLLAMGRTVEQALGVLRISFGNETEEADINRLIAALPQALSSAQRLDSFG